MTPTQFWLILGSFAVLVFGWLIAARVYVAMQRRLHERVNPVQDADPNDLDVKWSALWHERDLEHRASPLFGWLNDDEDAWVRDHPGWDTDDQHVWAARLTDEEGFIFVTAADTARLDKAEAEFAKKAAYAIDRGVRLWGYASLVDMFAQRLYDRRRSLKKMVALLDKTKTWPPEWQQQLDVLMAEGAVGRARVAVRSR